MAKQNRLTQRNGVWNFRVRVPDRLRAAIGKQEVWKSLGRVSHPEAARLARYESVRVDALFADAEAGLAAGTTKHGNPPTDSELERIVRTYFQHLEGSVSRMPLSATARFERQEAAEEDASLAGQTLDDPGLQDIATRLLIADRIELAEGLSVQRLVEGVQRALIEHHSREADRAALRRETAYDPLFADITKATPVSTGLTLAQAVVRFKAAPERANVAKKTRASYEFRYATLLALLGPSKAVSDVSRADLRSAQAVLLRLPPNAQKRFPTMTLFAAAEFAGDNGIAPMSAKSAMLYMHSANALFRWLENEDLVSKNPASGIRGPATSDESGRRSFTVPELNHLFAAWEFAGTGDGGRNWLYWLPRMALMTGARFAELLALRASDVVEEDGIAVLSIAPNADRKLKNKGSRRLVPLHPSLIKLGFLEYARKLPQHGPLFPDAQGPKDMLNARNKEMGRKLRSALADHALVFHSLRHTFKDAAKRARIPRDHIAMLGGWEVEGKRTAMDDYGRDPLVKLLRDDIATLAFEGLRL